MTEISFNKEIDKISGLEDKHLKMIRDLADHLIEGHKLSKADRTAYFIENIADLKNKLHELSIANPKLGEAVEKVFYAEINHLDWKQ